MNDFFRVTGECADEAFDALIEGLQQHWVAGALFACFVLVALS